MKSADSNLTLTIFISGLIGYSLGKDRIDAVFPAAGAAPHAGSTGHQTSRHHDPHTAALLIPLSAVDRASSAPDQIIDAGADEFGVWRIEGQILTSWLEGHPPEKPALRYYRSANLPSPTPKNEGDMFWLPDVEKATGIPNCRFRPDCFPPNVNRALVSSVVSLLQGTAVAYWPTISAQKEVWRFESVPHTTIQLPAYAQPFADGIAWSMQIDEFAELRLEGMEPECATRSIYVLNNRPNVKSVNASLSNKPALVDGVPVLQSSPEARHFEMYYDMLTPTPGPASRRVLKPPTAVTTKTLRCPGSAA